MGLQFMKILHCCLSNFYIDNYNYQENVLPKIHKDDGHEVLIIASTEVFVNNMKYGYTKPSEYFTKEGIRIIRVPYLKYLPHFIMKKVRHYKNVYKLVKEFAPDVILFHGTAGYELLNIAKYIKNNPKVKLYVDSHEDFHNSATNFISKNFLHRIFYKSIIQKSLPFIDKILYLTYESFEFVTKLYNIPENKLEFFPLGGIIPSEEKRNEMRKNIRNKLGLQEEDVLIIHTGKMNKHKRTEEILEAFTQVNNERLQLLLIGSINEEIKENVEKLIASDKRIKFLGWKSGEELLNYICACDLYLQLGSQSATMQNAVCCGCALALYPYSSHKYLLEDAVFYIESADDIVNLLTKIISDRSILNIKSEKSREIARDVLDYRILASRLYVK